MDAHREGPDDPSFAALIEAARRDRPGALARLLEGSRSFVHRAARRRLQGPCRPLDSPSDLAQEAAVVACRGLPAFRGTTEASWRAWLAGIVANLARNAIRDAARASRRAPRPGGEPEPADPGTSPSSAACRGEERARLADCLASLPEVDRRILRWREVENLSFEAIGKRLGISDVAARNRWKKALDRLERRFRASTAGGGPR